MAEEKNEKTIKTEVTVTHTAVNELQKALKKEYRTDHLTLPVIAPMQDAERDKASAKEREILLNPDLKEDAVVDDAGTTLKEYRDKMDKGIMPKNAPKAALKGVGKHKVEVVEEKGEIAVVVTAPITKEEVVIAHPDTEEGKTPFGMELMHKTTPVPETLDTTKDETAKPTARPEIKPEDKK